MKKLFGALLGQKPTNKLQLCKQHLNGIDLKDIDIVNKILPYAKDHCQTCYQNVCNACGQTHSQNRCHIKYIGTGVLKDFNLGQLMKVQLQGLKCTCGKPLNRHSAICAACGMASCSEGCHHEWQKMGNCTFKQNFYNVPQGFTMRSILFQNIYNIQRSAIKHWQSYSQYRALATRSSTSMISAYASGKYPHIFLQRGVRNYGIPNQQLLANMTTMERTIDYYLFGQRRCSCDCTNCSKSFIHSVQNCKGRCHHEDLNFLKQLQSQSKYHKQCNCVCDNCNSGIINSTHRFIDCMHCCERSRYNNDKDNHF